MTCPRIWRICAVALPVLGAAILFGAPAAEAQSQRAWCATATSAIGGGFENCGFDTFAQCRLYVQGLGAICHQNLNYQPPVSAPRAKGRQAPQRRAPAPR
ncbi:MAG TPA: DUF3551 domain-containing protein [Xanthobacteraceae bacterium]|nr:DUF3551 domain-containing protein [Xanthobacteraceae bacterium]